MRHQVLYLDMKKTIEMIDEILQQMDLYHLLGKFYEHNNTRIENHVIKQN